MQINPVLNETRDMPTFGMLKLTDDKINTLRAALRFEDAPHNIAATASIKNSDYTPNPMQAKVVELKALAARYNNGRISIEVYNTKLDELLDFVQSKGAAFQMAS